MDLKIRQQLSKVTKNIAKGRVNKRLYVTIHETANTAKGANAAAHANLQSSGNVRVASWQWQVDCKEAVQSFPHTTVCWHAGDGDKGTGNNASIGIEICVNSDGDFEQAFRNAAFLAAKIMREENIPLANLVTHQRWTKKNCPTKILRGRWQEFVNLVGTHLNGTPQATVSTQPLTPSGKEITMAQFPVITPGAKSVHVGIMQGALIARGYWCGPSGVDNHNGPATQAAFKNFQTNHPHTGTNGKPDGRCGAASWQQLLLGK